MSAISVHLDLRSAIRKKLLTASLLSVSASTISASGNQFLDSANGFGGVAVGDEITASGFANSGNNGVLMVAAATAGAITVNKALTTEPAGSARQVSVLLPSGRAWEGRSFEPVLGSPFISETMSPIYSEPRGLGVGGTIAHKITGNFTLHYPAGKGTAAIERMAGALLELFKPGTPLIYGQTSGVVQQAERRPLLVDADWISCPVVVSAVAYTAN